MAADGGYERDVVHRMNKGYRAWGALKMVLNNRVLGINANKCLYEGVIVPTALYGAEAWGMRIAQRRVGNEDVRLRAGTERELASRADQSVLSWFGHVERIEYRMARRVLMA